jgi:hypothetical protein
MNAEFQPRRATTETDGTPVLVAMTEGGAPVVIGDLLHQLILSLAGGAESSSSALERFDFKDTHISDSCSGGSWSKTDLAGLHGAAAASGLPELLALGGNHEASPLVPAFSTEHIPISLARTELARADLLGTGLVRADRTPAGREQSW